MRCPSCGARSYAAADWCGLCWADLRAAPAAPPVPDSPVAASAAVAHEPAVALEPAVAPGWPCTACGAITDLQLSTCHACGLPFLAAAATGAPLVGGPWGRLLTLGQGQRLVAALVAGLAGTALLLVLMALLGLVL